MKVLKRAEQKNVGIDMYMYDPEGLRCVMKTYKCMFWIYNEETKTTEYFYDWAEYDKRCWMYWDTRDQVGVSLFIDDQVTELKVIYDNDYNFYTTVAKMADGGMVYVKL